MKEFWSTILFRENGMLMPSQGRKTCVPVPREVRDWVGALLPVPDGGWETVSAERFPYSELFVFRQDGRPDVPEKIAVKKINIRHEDDRDLSIKGFNDEHAALTLANVFDGVNGIRVPRLYGASEDLCSIAIGYMKGVRFTNLLLEPPLKSNLLSANLPCYASDLGNLGRWLRRVHESVGDTLSARSTAGKIVARDAREIELRVEGLGKRRPADFPVETRRRLMALCGGLAREVIHRDPSLRLKHGDFSLVNVLYHNGELSVVDFTYFGQGLPEDDLARIYLDFLNIDSWSLALLPGKKGLLGSAFFEGYGKRFPGGNDPAAAFYLLKHALINTFMYSKQWGSRHFLNPFVCRVLYSIQRRFLSRLVDQCSAFVNAVEPRSTSDE